MRGLSDMARGGRHLVKVAMMALVAVSLNGCAGVWDEVTSNNFSFNHLISKPNPFQVLQNSNDGNERAQALRALREPRGNGGSEQDQDAVIKILCTAATTETRFLCRMAAIESLGRFRDPRAVDGLTDAFYASGSFPADLATRIQVGAVTSLGRTGNAKAEAMLVKLVQEKPKGTGSDQERQQIMDVRLAAARALGNFQDANTVQALQSVSQGEKDVALRDCCDQSIRLARDEKPPLVDFTPVTEFFKSVNPEPAVELASFIGRLFEGENSNDISLPQSSADRRVSAPAANR